MRLSWKLDEGQLNINLNFFLYEFPNFFLNIVLFIFLCMAWKKNYSIDLNNLI